MKRFRVTLLAVCLLLTWLGYSDLQLHFRNKAPQQITVQELEQGRPHREWLHVTGGYQNLLDAINMSGTMEIDAFLVPLRSTPDSRSSTIWFETRDPQIVELLKTYYFKLDNDLQRSQFANKNKDQIYAQRDLIGMTADSMVASNNQTKLEELLQQMKLPVGEHTVFISEGKEPIIYRGYFFAVIGILGILKLVLSFRNKPDTAQPPATGE
ncbi:hypothetical protein [Malonomonas rubra]|uniref:hypothetical protein n=1 Tax=Malonomonas rubra TaxID=57040 RepID=UPI0026EE73A1|nr:hypothetical protein [Malonomonas rubra]